VEDPFPPEALPPFLKLATHVGVPLAAGDEVTDPTTLVNLAESGALDVLRLDVATVGGITAAMRVLHRAESLRMPVSFHICPEISAHVAAASSSGHSVETFDRTGNRFDPSHELFEGGPKLISGSFVIPDEPGTGLRPVFTDAEEFISLL
jgi:L-alanine-DL-glutamate epimerase-like enolase superfamily enzyme